MRRYSMKFIIIQSDIKPLHRFGKWIRQKKRKKQNYRFIVHFTFRFDKSVKIGEKKTEELHDSPWFQAIYEDTTEVIVIMNWKRNKTKIKNKNSTSSSTG